jgi:hypothetical protein
MAARSNSDIEGLGLRELLSEAELLDLANAFGGIRLYVPLSISADHRLAKAVGLDAAMKLVRQMGGIQLRVPLMRDERARSYRQGGQTVAWIARRLCMTETGVERALRRGLKE